MSDYRTAISFVNVKGESNQSFVMNFQMIYGCGVHQKVSAAHIPGIQNTNVSEAIKWKLSTHLFQKVSCMFGKSQKLMPFWSNRTLNFIISFPLLAFFRKGDSKNLQTQKKRHCSDRKIAHATLIIYYNSRIYKKLIHYFESFTYKCYWSGHTRHYQCLPT